MSHDIQDLISEVSYCFSSAEADTFHRLLNQKKINEAKSILLPHLSQEKADLLMEYFIEKNSRKIKLEEISLSEIDLQDQEAMYLFRIGDELFQSPVVPRHGYHGFFARGAIYSIDDATQIWKLT